MELIPQWNLKDFKFFGYDSIVKFQGFQIFRFEFGEWFLFLFSEKVTCKKDVTNFPHRDGFVCRSDPSHVHCYFKSRSAMQQSVDLLGTLFSSLRGWCKKTAKAQNDANCKKSTILLQSSWYSANISYSWGTLVSLIDVLAWISVLGGNFLKSYKRPQSCPE